MQSSSVIISFSLFFIQVPDLYWILYGYLKEVLVGQLFMKIQIMCLQTKLVHDLFIFWHSLIWLIMLYLVLFASLCINYTYTGPIYKDSKTSDCNYENLSQ
jgi:hypothetical protein